MQITRKSFCCQIRNSAPFFVTPWPTSWTLVDVLSARCSQAMSNSQILDIWDFPWALLTQPCHPHRVPNEGLALQLPISLCEWATLTLKSFKICQKHAHIKKVLKKILCGRTFFRPTTQLWGGRRAERLSFFSGCQKVCHESFALLLGALGCPEML